MKKIFITLLLLAIPVSSPAQNATIAGGSSVPSGTAGGSLAGTYPNPSLGTAVGTSITLANGVGGGVLLKNAGGTADASIIETAGTGAFLQVMGTTNIWGAATNALTLVIDYGGTNVGAVTVSTAGLYVPALTTDAGATDATMCRRTSNGQLLSGTGTLGICLGTSGAQFKTAFSPMTAGIDEIAKLNLWNYRYLNGFGDNGERIQYGPTAQDVEKVLPDLVRYDTDGKAINYDAGAFVPITLHALQQLKADNDNLRTCQQNWKCRIFGIGG